MTAYTNRTRVALVPGGAKRRLMGRIARESHAGEGGVFGEALLFTQRSGQSGLLLFVQSGYLGAAEPDFCFHAKAGVTRRQVALLEKGNERARRSVPAAGASRVGGGRDGA